MKYRITSIEQLLSAAKYINIDKSVLKSEDLTFDQNSDSSDSGSEDEKPPITSEEVKNCLGKVRTFLKKM